MLTVAILGLLIYYLISGAPTIIGTTPSESVAIADNYVVQARSWQYEASGQRSHVLVMSDLQHFDSTGVSLVTQPLLEVYSEGQPVWTVSAENGRIIDQADHIELRDNVELSSLTSSLALATDAMDI
ncbi:MAG: LPS export ABC transporter protein LptC, partial [Halieaceae bacterium]